MRDSQASFVPSRRVVQQPIVSNCFHCVSAKTTLQLVLPARGHRKNDRVQYTCIVAGPVSHLIMDPSSTRGGGQPRQGWPEHRLTDLCGCMTYRGLKYSIAYYAPFMTQGHPLEAYCPLYGAGRKCYNGASCLLLFSPGRVRVHKGGPTLWVNGTHASPR